MFNIKNIFHLGWSHGEYLDYWSFIHLFTGIILGIGTLIFSFNPFLSFFALVILYIIYEGLEILVHISEGFWNIILDIVVGSVGSAVAIFFLPQILSMRDIFGILSIAIIIDLMLVYGGWQNFLQRKASEGSSYKLVLYALCLIYFFGILIALASFFYWLA